MSIITSVINQNLLQADGSRHITEYHIDHVGKIHRKYYTWRTGMADINTFLANHATIIETRLGKLEDREALGRILYIGENSLDVANNPIHSTSKRITKKIIYAMMLARNDNETDLVGMMVSLEPLLNYLNTNYTDGQLRGFLDITQVQLNKMRDKIKYILNAPVTATSVKDLVALADAEWEEWE